MVAKLTHNMWVNYSPYHGDTIVLLLISATQIRKKRGFLSVKHVKTTGDEICFLTLWIRIYMNERAKQYLISQLLCQKHKAILRN